MGADQSRPTNGTSSSSSSSGQNAGPGDFYTLLEVDEDAGELEIKVRPSCRPGRRLAEDLVVLAMLVQAG